MQFFKLHPVAKSNYFLVARFETVISFNRVVRLLGLLKELEVLAGQNDFIKTYICVLCITPYLPF